MFAKARVLRLLLLLGGPLSGGAGCLLVSPLDSLPEAAGKGAGGQNAGGENGAGTSPGGDSLGGAAKGVAGEGASAGQAGDSSTECVSNAECVKKHTDLPYRCRPSDHTCVPLRSDPCTLVYGDFKDPNAVYFGAFATFNPSAPDENSIIWSQQLALDELSGDLWGGLPGPNKTRRPLVMIVCNNADDVVDLGVAHLAERVQVPAMIATLKPGDLRKAFEDHSQRDIFYLSPVTVSHAVATADDDDKIWSLLGQPSDLAPTYAALLKLQEKRWKKDPARQVGDKLKVAVITTKAAFDSDLMSGVEPLLLFNDKPALDNGNDYYLPIKLDADDPQLEENSQRIIDFGPDVILSAASELFSMEHGLLQLIEEEWEGGDLDKPRPFYVLSPYNAGDLTSIVRLMSVFIDRGTDIDPQLRFVGVSVAGARDNTLQKGYEGRLHTLFDKANYDTANYYDATYFLAYAMLAAGTEAPLSGSTIAQGMRRLLDGTAYAVGPGGIEPTFDALKTAGSKVHVLSTLGPPDFDPDTGVRAVDGNVLCFERIEKLVVLHKDVLRYDRDLGKLTGTFPCFSGFFE
jgi:hypothetical protein